MTRLVMEVTFPSPAIAARMVLLLCAQMESFVLIEMKMGVISAFVIRFIISSPENDSII